MTSPKERPGMAQVSTEMLRIKHVASDTCVSDEANNWQDSTQATEVHVKKNSNVLKVIPRDEHRL